MAPCFSEPRRCFTSLLHEIGSDELVVLTVVVAVAQRPVLEETFERKRGELRQELEKHDQLEVVKGVGVDGGRPFEPPTFPASEVPNAS